MGYRRSGTDYSSDSRSQSSKWSPKRASYNTSVASTAIAKHKTYSQIKCGLRKSNPAAIVLWAFHQIPSYGRGLTSRRVINFLKKHYKSLSNPRKTGWSIGAMLRTAVDFGLLMKRGNRYYLTPPPTKTHK